MASLTTQYLDLADQLIEAGQLRPLEQARLANAAAVAQRLASLARQSEDAGESGYLTKAAALIAPALEGPIPASAVTSASVYAGMTEVYLAQIADQQRAEVAS